MKMTSTLIALGLLALSGGVQAATWTLDDSIIEGGRLGTVSFDAQVSGEHRGDLTDDLNDVNPAYVAAGSWRSFTTSFDGNAIEMGLSHEAHVQTSVGGDPATVAAWLETSVSLDNPSIGTPTLLSLSGSAGAGLNQAFVITPELGEYIGMPVWVTLTATYTHSANNTIGGYHLLSTLYLNDSFLDYAFGINQSSQTWTIPAAIGDRLTLWLMNSTGVGIYALELTTPGLDPILASGRVEVSLTVSPIPEPETWAMILAGLGLVGLQLRRKPRIDQKLEI